MQYCFGQSSPIKSSYLPTLYRLWQDSQPPSLADRPTSVLTDSSSGSLQAPLRDGGMLLTQISESGDGMWGKGARGAPFINLVHHLTINWLPLYSIGHFAGRSSDLELRIPLSFQNLATDLEITPAQERYITTNLFERDPRSSFPSRPCFTA